MNLGNIARKTVGMIKLLLVPIVIVTGLIIGTILVRIVNDTYDEVTAPTLVSTVQKEEALPAFEESDFNNQHADMQSAILGLYFQDNQGVLRFHCTAFVVSNKYALTAAHCVANDSGNMTKDRIYIYDSSLVNTGIIGKAVSMNGRGDFGVILGDFSNFHKLKVNSSTGFANQKGPFFSCGFPWGALPMVCQEFVPKMPFYDKVAGMGFLTPGMSGGPTIDQSTMLVTGINVEIHEGFVAISPVIGIWAALRIEQHP